MTSSFRAPFVACVFAILFAPPLFGEEVTYELPGGVPLVMVKIPAGTFQMGSPTTERSRFTDEPLHPVTLTQDYYMGKYEVTQAQWEAVMGTPMNASCGDYGVGDTYPVYCATWNDIRGTAGFITQLNHMLKQRFRLPTEAEWERAARGGTQTRFSFGDALDGEDSCGANAAAEPYVWWCNNSGNKTHPVGTKGANPYGLYDVHGNVFEWVEDLWGPLSATAQTDPKGAWTGFDRVARGGGFYEYGKLAACKSAQRTQEPPDGRRLGFGFRLAMSPTTSAANPVLFAHGFCSDCDTWKDMIPFLQGSDPERYGSWPRVDLYFDGTWVRNRSDDNQYFPVRPGYAEIQRPGLYTITYFDPSSGSKSAGFDKMKVKDIPIERLAGQLAAVVAAIRDRNGSAAVDVVSHGMGGLVTRALIEGLGQPQSQLEIYQTGSIRQLITLDTPHSGLPKLVSDAGVDTLNLVFSPSLWADTSVCFAASSTQKSEMSGFPLSGFLSALNSQEIPSSIGVTAIATTTLNPWYLSPFLIPQEYPHDGVVYTSSQNIKTIETYRCAPSVVTVPNSAGGFITHMSILAQQPTAALVRGALARSEVTGTAGGCQVTSPSVPAIVTLPGLAQQSAGSRTLVLAFPGASVPQGLQSLSETSCRATVVVRADSGAELARYDVPASGTQTLELGILPSSGWRIELTTGCASSVSTTLYYTPEDEFGSASRETLVPIALDVESGSAHYTTGLALVNTGATWALATIQYSPSLGSLAGAGKVIERLSPGSQKSYGDILEFLRQRGLSIPRSTAGQQGGTLLISFSHAESQEVVAAVATTTSPTSSPQPVGVAGLSYEAPSTSAGSQGSVTIHGLRDTVRDRSNVAVFNPTSAPVTVRMTAHTGDGTGYSAVVRDSMTLPAFGWTQVSNVFSETGIANGWVTIQRTSSSGRFGAYGAINDNATNDGSFVQPTIGTISGSHITVPVLVETSSFRSELVLANRGSSTASLTLRYVERLRPGLGSGGTVTVQLGPRQQVIIPSAIEDLRRRGMSIGAMDAGDYAGALRISVSGADLSDVYAAARTASPSPAGGQFGLFTPGLYESDTAAADAYVYGLRADSVSRSNVAVVNAGGDGDGSVTLEIQVFDGDRGGAAAGAPRVVRLAPGEWDQTTGVLGLAAVQNGWVRVLRTAGTAPWIAYGVVNDGGQPGERTGDGAYLPMTATTGALPLDGDEITYTLPGGVPLVMVRIPAGTFQMGAPASERFSWPSERPVHQVTLTSDYYIGKYEVTQAQWQAVVGSNPSVFKSCGGNCPVEQVTWDDIRGPGGFIAKLNRLLGTTMFRLPTEAEWERAARGGTQTRFSFGDALGGWDFSGDFCGANEEADPYAWWCGNAGSMTHSVGTKGANPYGLYDMHGNVTEWVEDWHLGYTSTAVTDPTGPATAADRVVRGGGWGSQLHYLRSAVRIDFPADVRSSGVGFRLSRSK